MKEKIKSLAIVAILTGIFYLVIEGVQGIAAEGHWGMAIFLAFFVYGAYYVGRQINS